MKPASRIQANIEILESLENARVPMDARVGDYMRTRRYIGAKDRAAVAERAYAMLRGFARLGWWLGKMGAPDSPRTRLIFWLMLVEGADEKRLKELFDDSKYAPPSLSEAELQFVKALSEKNVIGGGLAHPEMPLAVACECPPDYEDTLRSYFGDDFAAEMLAMLEPATLDLRVNVFLMSREDVQKSLEKDGVITQPTPYSPWGLRCESKAFISKTKAFNKGWISIQDEGSQLIAHVCGVQPGMQVLDFCAGGGGKTLALAAAMLRKGRIVAMDNDAQRLERGRQRYKKAQLADIIEVRPLSDEKHRKWLKRQKDKFDVVLLDVPCSGSGTWRRNPDLRWRNYAPPLAELLQTQREIMERAAPLVKPGGRLVYATCSLLPDENEAQIERFLKEHSEFTACSVPVILKGFSPEESGRHEQDPSAPALQDDKTPFMRLTPHRHNTDGFFAAILQKGA